RLVTHGEGARGANRVPVVRALHRMEMNMDRTEEARSTDALTEVPEQPAATEGADERNDQAPSGEESAPHGRIDDLTPRQVVAELDKYIVGQDAAKKAVAIALRNRWRRQRVEEELRDEIVPNNIIMIGP